jgi:hypothetical protein
MMDNGGSAMDEDDPLTTTQSSTKSHVKIASNYSVDPAKFDFLLTRIVQIEKMSEYGTEFIITPIVSNTYHSIFIPEKPDEQFNVNKVLILYSLLFK